MFEMILCSLFTIVPDYLFRRYRQGKRWGRELTLYSVWFELRWGITTCIILTVLLITLIFYYHPSTNKAISFFRTVPLLPEGIGRVDEVYVNGRVEVKAGQPIFKLESSKQEAALETAQRRITEVDAALSQAKTELLVADGRIQEAQSSLQQAQDELATQQELFRRKPGLTVTEREIERLQVLVAGREGGLAAAVAGKKSTEEQIASLLPAQKASAEAERDEAQVQVDKATIYAGVDGILEQFALRKGDIVNPLARPAGILNSFGSRAAGSLGGFRADRVSDCESGNAGRGRLRRTTP